MWVVHVYEVDAPAGVEPRVLLWLAVSAVTSIQEGAIDLDCVANHFGDRDALTFCPHRALPWA